MGKVKIENRPNLQLDAIFLYVCITYMTHHTVYIKYCRRTGEKKISLQLIEILKITLQT